MRHNFLIRVLYAVIPSLILALFYTIFLGYRRNYVGHYLSGFGGTLFVTMVIVEYLTKASYARNLEIVIIVTLVISIAYGTLLEATVFRIAKFDELDYGNQNLGAVLAALCALMILPEDKPNRQTFAAIRIMGLLFLVAGFYYAFS